MQFIKLEKKITKFIEILLDYIELIEKGTSL